MYVIIIRCMLQTTICKYNILLYHVGAISSVKKRNPTCQLFIFKNKFIYIY